MLELKPERPKFSLGYLSIATLLALFLCTVAPARSDDEAWLARINQYRAMVKLAPVRKDGNLALGQTAHARYLVETYAAAVRENRPLGVDMHIEDRSSRWYSYAGFVAGRSSDVLISTGAPSSSWAIDEWIAGPFHRFPLLSPDLASVGYGSFCDNGVCAAAINVQSGASSADRKFIRRMTSGEPITGESEALGGGWGSSYRKPIEFPPDGSTVDILTLTSEWPDPISSCPGFRYPVGLPITLQFGWNLTPSITGGRLLKNGKPVRACAFHSQSYRNPDPVTQKLAHNDLQSAGAIVIIPEMPLETGAKYSVHTIVNDVAYDWSFSVSPPSSGSH